ncbi:sugar kinase [Sulfobacillus harzensis]|uniref:Sugar kinase n=1 Tax=Sulfobacillus harzensis TaxID=2729629 RepID=A0A7Y0L160_9FIRM|nr:sugar kinase [Sulfobacillus harzensis]NMP21372.1 sugar kinase [Sulfobacillus harzensis]
MTPVVTAGEPLGLLTPATRGRVGVGSSMTFSMAGSECNVAIALARLGIPVWFGGAVGNDPAGNAVIHTLRAEGVNVDLLNTNSHPTGLMMKEWFGLKPEPRVFYYCENTAMHAWEPPLMLSPRLTTARLHLSGITLMIHSGLRERMLDWMKAWVEANRGGVSLDLNIRWRLGDATKWRETLQAAMASTDLIFASRSELMALWDTDDSAQLNAQGILGTEQVLVVTDGDRGAWAEQGGHHLGEVPAWPVGQVTDVVGAGDGFAAGVLAGRIRGWSWPDSLKLGSIVGAFAVAHPGDWEGYPYWAEVAEILDGRWLER